MAIDRKAVIREYKETPRVMGVARVHNTTDDRSLLMAGTNLPALINRHQAQLRLGGHPNRALQDDWNRLGADAFVFEVLDTLTPSSAPDYDPADDLRELEALWMEKIQPYEPAGYHRKPKRP